jgi:hypothetical protein
MNGSLEPEDRILEEPTITEQLSKLIETLGWEVDDDVIVEVGGTVVSGIHQGENYNKKWATPFGVRKYNKDAFIIISNQSRRDLTGSQPMDREHKPHHTLNTSEEVVSEDDVSGIYERIVPESSPSEG